MDSFVQRLQEQSAKYGNGRWFAFVEDRRGAVTETGRLSYAGLEQRARGLGAWLAEAGMTDSPVLLLYPAGLEFLNAFFGCLYARSVAVPGPLPATDPRALERAEKIIRDAGIRLILTDASNEDCLRQWLRRIGLDGRVGCASTEGARLPVHRNWSDPAVNGQTTAYLQYTSGSTSEPKGVEIKHANLMHNSRQINTVLGSPRTGTGAGWLPHYHDMGLVGQFLQPLYSGGNLVFSSPITFVARPVIWLQMISRYRAGFTMGPNFAYEWLVRGAREEDLASLDISCLEWALNGAEPVRASTLRKVSERFGPIGFRPRTWAPAYGMAESTVLVTGNRRGQGPRTGHFDPTMLERHRAVPVRGGPGSGVELVSSGSAVDADLRIVDHESRAVLQDGQVGEIWVASESVAQGYWKNEAATEETFQACLADGTGPFLRTGDLGFLDDGSLFITGRLKELIIFNGRNLYPQDIEEAGRGAHPAAGPAAAFGVDTGREHIVLVQEIYDQKLDGLSCGAVASQIRRAAEIAAGAPVSLFLVPRNSVLRTTSGKIRRQRIRELLLSRKIKPLRVEAPPSIRSLTPECSGSGTSTGRPE
ncbi:fatty acyl-AMP ligase [Streptomyces iconiensis]|uniref:Fatty acyl-AMP ligase n=1 Tax=Streptomyces iconiensis TaxID=1384038 RepID=A0ABT6ZNN2_9ACTN|nr:fatty acyl-AMP ligase [Streptomyces iconiensis]MDJ1130482.1 fatty acyl-AMP ligase [Streptomyces iconiensis]